VNDVGHLPQGNRLVTSGASDRRAGRLGYFTGIGMLRSIAIAVTLFWRIALDHPIRIVR
jgi:hypothetical protein